MAAVTAAAVAASAWCHCADQPRSGFQGLFSGGMRPVARMPAASQIGASGDPKTTTPAVRSVVMRMPASSTRVRSTAWAATVAAGFVPVVA